MAFQLLKHVPMVRIFIFLIFFVVAYGDLRGQTSNRISFFQLNPEFYNPALAGNNVHASAIIYNRTQWLNIDGAPQVTGMSYHTPITLNSGAGANLAIDQIGNARELIATGDFSYRIPVHAQGRWVLALGVRFGYKNWSFNPTDEQVGDPNFNKESINVGFAGAGVFLYAPKFHVGLAIPRLSLSSNTSNNKLFNDDSNEIILNAGYLHEASRDFSVRFNAQNRFSKSSLFEAEASVLFLFYDLIYLGTGYIFDYGPQFFAGARVNEKLEIGYAYDNGIAPGSVASGGSHEVILTYRFSIMKKLLAKDPSCFGGKWRYYYVTQKFRRTPKLR
jgi:type IX secretion system PorP/SprF family membrane protein